MFKVITRILLSLLKEKQQFFKKSDRHLPKEVHLSVIDCKRIPFLYKNGLGFFKDFFFGLGLFFWWLVVSPENDSKV